MRISTYHSLIQPQNICIGIDQHMDVVDIAPLLIVSVARDAFTDFSSLGLGDEFPCCTVSHIYPSVGTYIKNGRRICVLLFVLFAYCPRTSCHYGSEDVQT